MSAESVALDHYRDRRVLVDVAARIAAAAWSRVDADAIVASWQAQLPEVATAVSGAQFAAAQTADTYLDGVLAGQGIPLAAEGAVNARALAGVASDGRDLISLLYQPVIAALLGIQGGAPPMEALMVGMSTLDMIVRTQVADAGRVADGIALTGRRGAGGYMRMVVGRTCSRCIILAGRWYRWNAGFDRHPCCDCVGIPSAEAISGDLRLSPRAYFDSLSKAEQDTIFTKAGARAIRDGANMNQIVNARRGARGLNTAGGRITAAEARMLREGRTVGRLRRTTVYGQELYITSEGVTTRGVAGRALGARRTGVRVPDSRYRSARAPRLMPESIYEIAGHDRAEAIRLLRRFGYIL